MLLHEQECLAQFTQTTVYATGYWLTRKLKAPDMLMAANGAAAICDWRRLPDAALGQGSTVSS